MSNIIYNNFCDKNDSDAIDAEVGLICIDMMAIRDICQQKGFDAVTNLIDVAIIELVRHMAQKIKEKKLSDAKGIYIF